MHISQKSLKIYLRIKTGKERAHVLENFKCCYFQITGIFEHQFLNLKAPRVIAFSVGCPVPSLWKLTLLFPLSTSVRDTTNVQELLMCYQHGGSIILRNIQAKGKCVVYLLYKEGPLY